MSPEATATAAALARLLAEIDEDRRGLAKRIADVREAKNRLAAGPEDPASLALAAVGIHGWYTGLEAIFERIARELDMSVPSSDRWHRELLTQMTAEIPSVRPSVIDSSVLSDLVLILAFRHFFRHAYAVAFDPERLATEVKRVLSIEPTIRDALDGFVAFLKEAMHRVRGN